MKRFEPAAFDFGRAGGELRQLETLLAQRAELDARADILPFFRQRLHLTALIGSLFRPVRCEAVVVESKHIDVFTYDRLARALRAQYDMMSTLLAGR